MAEQLSTRHREDQINAGVRAFKRQYPDSGLGSDETRSLVTLIVDAAEEIPNPVRSAASEVCRFAELYLAFWDLEPAGDSPEARIARRNLREALLAI